MLAKLRDVLGYEIFEISSGHRRVVEELTEVVANARGKLVRYSLNYVIGLLVEHWTTRVAEA